MNRIILLMLLILGACVKVPEEKLPVEFKPFCEVQTMNGDFLTSWHVTKDQIVVTENLKTEGEAVMLCNLTLNVTAQPGPKTLETLYPERKVK